MRSLFAAALAAHLAGTHALKATVLPQAFADLYGAKCLDGTPPAIYTSLNSSSSTWLLFLEGGGWCFDTTSAGVISNCFGRAAGGGGSSAGIANGSTNNIGGLLSEDPAVNPRFFSSNLVFMHYCDGSSYSSYRPDAIPAPPGLQAAVPGAPAQIWMRGRANLRAVVAYLLEALGMAAGSELVVSGGSAGATGVYLGLEYIREWVPGSLRVAGAPDAGLFLDVSREGTNDTWYRDSFAAAAPIWGGSDISSAGCMAAYPTEAWRCYLCVGLGCVQQGLAPLFPAPSSLTPPLSCFLTSLSHSLGPSLLSFTCSPEYNAYYIATPMLISNSPIDMWGLGNILSLGCIPFMDNATHGGMKPCPPAQWGALQVWFDEFHARLDPYLAASPASRSAFIPSCYVHEINVGTDSLRVSLPSHLLLPLL